MAAVNVPHRVVWSEGMLVSPQHLQQADLYHERLLDRRLAALAPQTWGILSLEVDQGALAAGDLRVSRFVGFLPDGLCLDFAAGDPEAPAARPIGTHFAPAQPVLEVFLAVPKERDGIPSVAAETEGSNQPVAGVQRTRFSVASRPVGDMTGESADLPIAFARRNVSLLFGDEARDDFDSIKIAEILRNASGVPVVSEAFIPSVLSIAASPFLSGGVRRLLALMTAKQRQLAQERRQRDAVTVEFGVGDVTRYVQLSALNAAIPLLVHAGRDGEMSPRELYSLAHPDGRCSFPPWCPMRIPRHSRLSTSPICAPPSRSFSRFSPVSCAPACARPAWPCPWRCGKGLHVGNLKRRAHREVLPVCPGGSGAREFRGATGARAAGPGQDRVLRQLPFLLRSATRGLSLQVTHRPPAEVPVRPQVAYFLHRFRRRGRALAPCAQRALDRHLRAAALRSRAAQARDLCHSGQGLGERWTQFMT
jgi:type VI secretion system protein ImpJ